MATYDVADRSAIVTGAGAGIGRAIARELAANGASVLVVDLDGDSARSVAKEITDAGGTAEAFTADVADPSAAEEIVAAASKLGPLRIAVNNAGIGDEYLPIAETSVESWQKVIGVNLNGMFYGMKAQIPAIIAAGGGSIVNMSSALGSVGRTDAGSYVTTKHGILGLTKVAALEYGASGVRVNAVGPGVVLTPSLEEQMDEAMLEEVGKMHALGRIGTSEEVASLVSFLASDAASFVTGSYHLVDGGYTAQ